MIFWRIYNSQLYPVKEVEHLGFDINDPSFIPDEYLDRQEFCVFRTCSGIGDFGIISAMPRLLKEKYPNCYVSVPSPKFLKTVIGKYKHNWGSWSDPFQNIFHIFKNNPYVDKFVDEFPGDIFHDHFRIYNPEKSNTPLIQQMLKFWQFKTEEMEDYLPELYFSEEEVELGEMFISKYLKRPYGALLVSNRYVPEHDKEKIQNILNKYPIPFLHWTSVPLQNLDLKLESAFDLRHIKIRLQLYLKANAQINIGNQSGISECVCRYSNVIEIARSVNENYLDAITYL